jgi:hypothetical protein
VNSGVFIRSMEMVNLVLMLSYATYATYKFINPVRRKTATWFASLCAGIVMLGIMLGSAYLLMYASQMI